MNMMEINKAVSEMSREQLADLSRMMKRRYNDIERIAKACFRVGDQVVFTDRYGDTVEGKVIKINPKRVKVEQSREGRAPITWTVSPTLLTLDQPC